MHETRLLSEYQLHINGGLPWPSALSNVEQNTWLGYYLAGAPGTVREHDSGSGQLEHASQQSVEIRISRVIEGGLHEDIDITNFTQRSSAFDLEIALSADFADVIEASGDRQRFGTLTRRLAQADGCSELEFTYIAERRYREQNELGSARLERKVKIRFENADSVPILHDTGVRFSIVLRPHQQWHTCLRLVPVIDGLELGAPVACHALRNIPARSFLDESTKFCGSADETLSTVVIGALEQGRYDLDALRLTDLHLGEHAWTMAAGLPMYVALFGRDTLTAGWQAALTGSEMMRGALLELAKWQGTEVNDWRDEQPGRMLHEAHDGPLEVLNLNPRRRSYGSVTTAALYPLVLAELWHWTGDREFVRRLVPSALAALKWLDDYGRHASHGFYDYQTRSKDGVKNQAWKDSGDAIVAENGEQVSPPIAACEEQAFVFVSKQFLSELLWWLDERDDAKRLRREAADLKLRFNDRFWMEDHHFVALGLDRDGRQIRSIASNAGHCIAAGVLDEDRVPVVADRLMREDLFTGWGIRTLSSEHPAYNPYSYHRGSVWPVEQGTFVLGFRRYGLHTLAERLSRAVFEAAALFDCYRLPELIAGHPRDAEHVFPGMYPKANSPQAWSSSTVFLIVQTLLGLYPYAPLNVLLVDPHLPEWLPELTVRDLRVGQSLASIRFFRKGDGASGYDVLDIRGTLHVIHQPSPWSLTASFRERLRDLVSSIAH